MQGLEDRPGFGHLQAFEARNPWRHGASKSMVDLEQLTRCRHLRLVLRQLRLRLVLLARLGLHHRVLLVLHGRVHRGVVPAAARRRQGLAIP